jgi:acetyl esterase/lipase
VTPTYPVTLPPVPGALAAFYQTPDPLSPAPPGSIIRAQQIPVEAGLPDRTTAFRILYHSESVDGTDIAVSGIVVLPGRPAPPGGYRIVSWAHGTTGLADACAPSMDGIGDIPYLPQLLELGYVVAATDYEGLGTGGVHPYLVGQSEGQSVLDAARAARDLVGPDASDEVVVFGHSQGGQAALFAGQIAGAYAPELFIAGVVSVAPVSDVDEFVPATVGRTADPLAVYTVASLYAWSRTYGDLPLADVLTPRGVAMSATIDETCINALADEFAGLPTDRLFRAGWEEEPAVVAHEAQNAPGAAPTIAPILVVQGVSDDLVPFSLTSSLVEDRLCRGEHDTVQYDAFRDEGHSNVIPAAEGDVLRWMVARLAVGRTAPDSCDGPVRTLPA